MVGGDGDPTKRGVVSTASYEARAFGVRSGMPLRTALKKCPDAVFLAVDADHYLIASRDVMATLRSFPAVVQNAGWDEAFMEVLTDEPDGSRATCNAPSWNGRGSGARSASVTTSSAPRSRATWPSRRACSG